VSGHSQIRCAGSDCMESEGTVERIHLCGTNPTRMMTAS